MDAQTSLNSSNIELFQNFMNAYSSISNSMNYSGSIDGVKESDGVISLGTRVSSEAPELYEALQIASQKNSAKILYAHPIEDLAMQSITTQFMKYEPGAEEGLVALLGYYLLKSADLTKEQRAFFDNLDLGYLEAESNVGQEEFEEMVRLFETLKRKTLVIGSDIMAHTRAQNIAKLCALIEKNSDFSLLIVPDESQVTSRVETKKVTADLEEIKELPEFNGTVIYNINAPEDSDRSLYGSMQFARAAKISDGDFVSISFGGQTINREFRVSNELKGTIAINPTFDINIDTRRYKFERSKIDKINQNSESNNE